MKEIGLSLAGLGLLYLTRRKLTAELGKLVGEFGGGQRTFIWLWSVIFLPGTIIHEMSHLFAAAITGTKIGKVEIFPELPRGRIGAEFDQSKKSVHLGYVQTQELGLFRGFLVGTAPLLVGLGILAWIASTLKFSIFNFQFSIATMLKIYVFFTVANSLFLSWADVKQALPLPVIAAIFGFGMYFLGIRPEIVPDSRLIMILNSLWKAVAASAGVNLGAVIILWAANGMLGRLRGFRGI